jgi:hypothetical protein
MLRYAGYTWLLDARDSPIQARIGPGCRTHDEVHWQVDFHYIAAGREWRRVKSWLRPTLRFCVYGFQPAMESWQDLEGQSFSSDDSGFGGTLFLESTRWDVTGDWLNLCAHRLQFVKRRGFWFTTELVASPANRRPASMASLATASVGGNEASSFDNAIDCEPDPSALYMVEDLPFGLVEVAAPANSRRPEHYASTRAHDLIGIEASAEVEIGPRLAREGKDWRPVAGADWRVRLHHGARWTHFTL